MKNRGNDLFSNQIPKLLITSENKILLVLKLEKKHSTCTSLNSRIAGKLFATIIFLSSHCTRDSGRSTPLCKKLYDVFRYLRMKHFK